MAIRATTSRAERENTAPVGLLGLLTMMTFVRGVTARRTRSPSRSNPLASTVSTTTGTPPTSRTCSGYETQYGLGISTSSPGFTSAMTML